MKGHNMKTETVSESTAMKLNHWLVDGIDHWQLIHKPTGKQKTFAGNYALVDALIDTCI